MAELPSCEPLTAGYSLAGMASVVVPFRGESAKQRLAPAPEDARRALADAMLRDVLAACEPIGATIVATEGGQGEAVEAALREVEGVPILVVNADVPCAQPRDLLTLLGALPEAGMALVAAADATTNALALSAPHLFAPLYGARSAERFLARAARLGARAAVTAIPNLADDVDSLDDLERLEGEGRLGPHTRAALDELRTGLPR
jgi:2-phospho-L-lactate guanylyltransferase (CobY/MobA/RfbA family)